MSSISTHVLDLSRGRPADRVPVILEARSGADEWEFRTRAVTDNDGRIQNLLPEGLNLSAGVYRITFDTGDYFAHHDIDGFYPQVSVTFAISNPGEHHHVPLLLSPYGYTTYRGS